MKDKSLFEVTLGMGEVIVRRWWVNTQSEKDQVSVQFQQEIEKETDENSLVALAQGGNSKQRPTTIFSFKSSVAQAILGSTEGSFVDGGQPLAGSEMWKGREVNIQVTENFAPNPRSKSHQPKSNPVTGEVVVAFNPASNKAEEVYRHTEMVAGKPTHTFIDATYDLAGKDAKATPPGVDISDLLTR